MLGDAVGNGGEAFGRPALGCAAAAGMDDRGRCVCKVVVMESLFSTVAIFPGEEDAGDGIGCRDVEVRQGTQQVVHDMNRAIRRRGRMKREDGSRAGAAEVGCEDAVGIGQVGEDEGGGFDLVNT